MITAAQSAKSLYGAWRLARFDPDGLKFFDNSLFLMASSNSSCIDNTVCRVFKSNKRINTISCCSCNRTYNRALFTKKSI